MDVIHAILNQTSWGLHEFMQTSTKQKNIFEKLINDSALLSYKFLFISLVNVN